MLFSEEPEASPSTGGFGGGPLSSGFLGRSCGGSLPSGFLGGSLSVKGRVPTESWE